ncbi:MAG: hypothetical protein J2P54_25940, partial [Bradyrhizobiaceae bacterium]|nr:hypothetical protein [Bradyrhizobiaceae bacterium]
LRDGRLRNRRCSKAKTRPSNDLTPFHPPVLHSGKIWTQAYTVVHSQGEWTCQKGHTRPPGKGEMHAC